MGSINESHLLESFGNRRDIIARITSVWEILKIRHVYLC